MLSVGSTTYTAEIEQTGGLRVGEDVQIYGVPVGTVRDIKLTGDRVTVEFTVDNAHKLGDRTSAAVQVATFLGTHMLQVFPAGSGQIESIPIERTEVPFNLQDVLEGGSESLTELDADQIAASLVELSKTMSATKEEIGPALRGVARLSGAIGKRSEQNAALIEATRGVSDQLARSSKDIIGLMRQSNLVFQEVTKRRQAIHRLLVNATSLSENINAVVRETRADMGPALRKLNQVLAVLRSQEATLKRLIDHMGPASGYVANATGNGPWVEMNFWQDSAIPPDDVQCRLGLVDC